MPDLQSELAKVNEAISSWEAPEPPAPKSNHFKPTNNVTRATFNYMRDNPGVTRVRVVDALVAQGHVKSSVSSLIGQMVRQRQVRETNGSLFVTRNEYTPLKSGKAFAASQQKTTPAPAPKKAPVNRKAPAAPALSVETVQVVKTPALSVESILRSLSVLEARRLYDELKTLFG